MAVTNIFISYGCSKDPYSWSKLDNMAFYSLTRLSFSLGCMMIACCIILGHSPVLKIILGSPILNIAGHLVYPVYLISPIIMMLLYSSTDHGTFMTLLVCIDFAMGHIVITFSVAFIIYLFIQWPIIQCMRVFLHQYLSHDSVIK